MQQRPVGGINLLKVRQHITVGQHRPFRHAGGTARVLQKCQILRHDLRLHVLHPVARMQGAAEGDGIRQVVFRHQPLNVFNDKVDQRTFRGRELVAHARQDDVFNLGFFNHFFQRVGKVGDNHNRRRAAVIQLMFQLARGIERVNVNHDHPCPEDPEQRHRVLQQVWHHQRDAIPFLQAQPFL